MGPFRRLFSYVSRYQRAFVLGLACTVVTQAVSLVSPKVLQFAVDDLTRGVTRAKLFEYGTLLLAIGLVGGVFRFLMRRILIGASRDIEYDMRNDFFAHLEKLPPAYFQTHRTGDLMSRATNDLNAVRMMIGPSIMYSANTLLTFVVALAMMVSIDARLTLFSLIPLPFVSVSVKFFGSAIHKRFEKIQAQLSEVSAVAQEALAGVRVVRAYRQEDAEMERFRRSNQEYLDRNRLLIVLQGFFFPSMSFFLGLGALVVVWLGSREVVRGRITVGEFVAFNAYLTMLAWPMIAFGWVTNMLQRGMASWQRMLEVLDVPVRNADFPMRNADLPMRNAECGLRNEAMTDAGSPQINPQINPHSALHIPHWEVCIPQSALRSVKGAIEFRHLTFAYGTQPVLHDVSAVIPAGSTVALVGPTGSGKSTLIALVARLHDPPAGTVFVDGLDVLDMPLAVLRGAIGFVPQEPFLFSDTLADNIAFGLDASHARASVERDRSAKALAERESDGSAERSAERQRTDLVRAAAAIARLDKDVADFPIGYETVVGERGITLSGGQKQRTAIARAIVIDPRILVLDDALSAVDTYTEEEILSRLQKVMQERTSIIVSHRISTVRRADQIFVLDDGRIVERGTHDELIRSSGLYAELHKKQLLEEELAAS
jgi:ATP-binding cassette subfamily B protein